MIAPQSGAGTATAATPHERLAHTLEELEDAGLQAIGQVAAPRPVHGDPERAAVLRAGRHRHLDLPRDALGLAARATWSGRVEASTGKPVEHVVSEEERLMESASIAAGTRPRRTTTARPPANVSSRVEAQFLGMLLFIISEVMLFGAFFTAYFFIRVVDGRRSGSRSTASSCRRRSPA